MKKVGNFKKMLDELMVDDIDYICEIVSSKMGQECDTEDFFDEVEDWEVKPNSPNIYIKFDNNNQMKNLFGGVNVYTGGKYNPEIDGPEEYKSIGFSFTDFLGSDIYVCSKSGLLLKTNVDIIASIVWEITRYGNTEEERMETKEMLKGSYE